MKTSKITANSDNFNTLQLVRNYIADYTSAKNLRWGGFWNGMNWENFSFYCTPQTLDFIKSFCKENDFSIEFSK